ncbi:MAG: hypothetical protein KAG06_01175 [Methylococcales bacterium]|nr:hypothetical protein [Methylococcales bacterium]
MKLFKGYVIKAKQDDFEQEWAQTLAEIVASSFLEKPCVLWHCYNRKIMKIC